MKKITEAPAELIIIVLYSFAHILLIDGSIYWDDWVWYDNRSQLALGVKELGIGPLGFFLEFMYNNSLGLMFSKAFVFTLGLLTGLIFKKILDEFPYFSKENKIFITLFFVLAPLNVTKSSLCVSNNILANFLFYLGAYFLIKSSDLKCGRSIALKVLSFIFLFCSYFTNSYLVFTVVLYFAYFFKIKDKTSQNKSVFYLKEFIPLILLPIIFWIVKKKYFMPSGLYSTYNQINLFNVGFIFKSMFKVVFYAFSRPVELILSIQRRLLTIVSVLIACGFFFVLYKRYKEKALFINNNLLFMFLGGGAFFVAAFPYLVVGKIPNFTFHESRHQLLMHLGYSFTGYYFLEFVFSQVPKVKKIVCWTVIGFLFVLNLNSYVHVHVMKQSEDALMKEFSTNKIYQENKLFFFDYINMNQLPTYSAIVSNYEYTGMFFEVFHEQTRLPIMLDKELQFADADKLIKERYKIVDVSKTDTYVKVVIRNKLKQSWGEKVLLIVYSIFDRQAYDTALKDLFTFEYEVKPTAELEKAIDV